jgi:hypothetical protein
MVLQLEHDDSVLDMLANKHDVEAMAVRMHKLDHALGAEPDGHDTATSGGDSRPGLADHYTPNAPDDLLLAVALSYVLDNYGINENDRRLTGSFTYAT